MKLPHLSILKAKFADEADEVTDREILNVIRRSEDRVLKTKEIAEPLPISPDWTNKRLNDLEEDGRVHSKSAGSGHVWWLDESEPKTPVRGGIADFGWYSSKAKGGSNLAFYAGKTAGVETLVLVVVIFLSNRLSFNVPYFSNDQLAFVATIIAILGAVLMICGGVLLLIRVGLNRLFTFQPQ